MQTRSATGLCAGGSAGSWNFAEVFARQIGMSRTTGPSMSPMFISGLPLVRSINAASLTKIKGCINFARFVSDQPSNLPPVVLQELRIDAIRSQLRSMAPSSFVIWCMKLSNQ